MKKILFTTSLFIYSFLFGQISENEIIGEWVVISETYSNCQKANQNITNVSKNEDGCLTSPAGITSCKQTSFKTGNNYYSKIIFNGSEMAEEGSYKINGDKLTITIEGFATEYKVSFDNNQLTLISTLLGCDYKVISKKE